MTAPYAAVAGWPAAHSLSPLMMTTWLEAAGIEGRYGVIETPPERFAALVNSLPSLGLAGLNVTIPHKTAALTLADEVSDAAREVGAANLLTVTKRGLHAHNTDVAGVAAALCDDDATGPALVFGAGGAARAALRHLKNQGREIRLINRTRDRAEALCAELGVDATVHTDPDPALKGAGLIINATSLGMAGQPALKPDFSTCAPGALAFDMVYTPLETAFLSAARGAGLKTADGLTMLIGQARPSFEAFFGSPPPRDESVRAVLEARLGGPT